MTTLTCACGAAWTEGPTRDIKTATCRQCLALRVVELKAALKARVDRCIHLTPTCDFCSADKAVLAKEP